MNTNVQFSGVRLTDSFEVSTPYKPGQPSEKSRELTFKLTDEDKNEFFRLAGPSEPDTVRIIAKENSGIYVKVEGQEIKMDSNIKDRFIQLLVKSLTGKGDIAETVIKALGKN